MILIEKKEHKFSIEDLYYSNKIFYRWYFENELKNYPYKSEKEKKDNFEFVKYGFAYKIGIFYYLKATQTNELNFNFMEYIFNDLSKKYKKYDTYKGKKFTLKEVLKAENLYNLNIHKKLVDKYITENKTKNYIEYFNLYKSANGSLFEMLTQLGEYDGYRRFIEFIIDEINK